MDRGTKRERKPGEPDRPLTATPYPTKVSTPPQPESFGGVRESAGLVASQSPAAMLRGFTRGGTIHLLGGATLPDGVFVKVIPE